MRFGNYELETGSRGSTLTNLVEGRFVFCPSGEASGDLFDVLEELEEADPCADYERHLAALWAEFAPQARRA